MIPEISFFNTLDGEKRKKSNDAFYALKQNIKLYKILTKNEAHWNYTVDVLGILFPFHCWRSWDSLPLSLLTFLGFSFPFFSFASIYTFFGMCQPYFDRSRNLLILHWCMCVSYYTYKNIFTNYFIIFYE